MKYQIYIVTSFGKPVKLNPKYEDVPSHADMLRYDNAYHDPKDPSRIFFPKFRRSSGFTQMIHREKWDSFSLTLTRTEESVVDIECLHWIGYKDDPGLTPETLEEFLIRTKLSLK